MSIITWMEVLVGADASVEEATRLFLGNFRVIDLTDEIEEHAVSLRRAHGIKLPGAVIWATAEIHSLLLVTRNEKDFAIDAPGVRIPYRL